jgi:hypothetical protein
MDVIVEGALEVINYIDKPVGEDLYELIEVSRSTAGKGDLVVVDPRRGEVHEVLLRSEYARTVHLYPIMASTGHFFTRRHDGLYLQNACILVAHEP